MTPRALFLFLSLTAKWLLPASTVQAAETCLQFSLSMQNLDPRIAESLQSKLENVGHCIEISKIPPSRATIMMKNAQLDGDLGRVLVYAQTIGDAGVRVPVPIVEGYGLIVSTSADMLSFDRLHGRQIGVLRGYQWHKDLFPPHAFPLVVDDYSAGMKMLETGRIPALLIDSISFSHIEEKPDILYRRSLTPKMSAYLYLHKRHRSLVPRFEAAMREWRADYYAKTGG
ncbi:transporter substrate-binding domain-containing protein [Roseibium aggregatum]|uniref:Transporter substrate-binding domain-containing protein n=1 Tax=Roseibium aggregatum TaxID=187304 RepID=A0A939EHJ9_9HYPH|nr:transporter substrate-binding domain-containing protein [Roseibium aggregatum]MBN9671664.1 transporter substrate-binding domain-containing protein [Roseibium aggregatum]